MGNRGCLHIGAGRDGRLGRARWRTKAWIACRLDFKGRRRDPMPERRWTALFFWDEASALAAGHRPCGECRRADHLRFKAAWAAAGLPGRTAAEIDGQLHPARIGRDRRPLRHTAGLADLPHGAMACDDQGRPLLRLEDLCLLWTPDGYRPVDAPTGPVDVLTPAPLVAVLAAGYRPEIRLADAEERP